MARSREELQQGTFDSFPQSASSSIALKQPSIARFPRHYYDASILLTVGSRFISPCIPRVSPTASWLYFQVFNNSHLLRPIHHGNLVVTLFCTLGYRLMYPLVACSSCCYVNPCSPKEVVPENGVCREIVLNASSAVSISERGRSTI